MVLIKMSRSVYKILRILGMPLLTLLCLWRLKYILKIHLQMITNPWRIRKIFSRPSHCLIDEPFVLHVLWCNPSAFSVEQSNMTPDWRVSRTNVGVKFSWNLDHQTREEWVMEDTYVNQIMINLRTRQRFCVDSGEFISVVEIQEIRRIYKYFKRTVCSWPLVQKISICQCYLLIFGKIEC